MEDGRFSHKKGGFTDSTCSTGEFLDLTEGSDWLLKGFMSEKKKLTGWIKPRIGRS
jgi:hypothetical protein